MPLREYRKKRDFRRTPEPPATVRRSRSKRSYVIQKHAASRLHYDFRLEHDGVLKSWAVPKGPSLDPAKKRLAVMVEDHPLDYGGFEGVIPKGEYGAGSVLLWDRGRWVPKGDVDEALRKGRLEFELQGEKLEGGWILVKLRSGSKNGNDWLLIKRHDEAARVHGRKLVVDERPESVASGRKIEEIVSGVTRERGPKKQETKKRTSKPKGEKLPTFVAPELATLVTQAPAGDEWLHEIKFDGYRMLARLDGGGVRWLTRNGLDWSHRFAPLSRAIAALPARQALFDGEIVVLRSDGTSDFQDLQKALSERDAGALRYFVFDLLHLDGRDLRPLPLEERKRALKKILGRMRTTVRFSDHVAGDGPAFHEQACKRGLEGIVSKRRDRPYRSTRSRDWLKVKCGHSQEVVVVGYTAPGGSRVGLGALVLGVRDKKKLRYAGRVGTGFDRDTLIDLKKRLQPLRTPDPPFDDPVPRAAARGVTWVEPRLVAAVRFTGWTTDGLLRHPTFQGLREDKPAAKVVREKPVPTPSPTPGSDNRVAGIEITHPDRVLYPDPGITKIDLARFYERIAPLILPHVRGRPLSVLRCPEGQSGSCFFQKHGHATFPGAVGSVEVKEKSGRDRYLSIDSKAGLVALVQMGVLEFHPWGSRNDRLERPDRMFFDIDPAPDVAWERVAEAARILRELLLRLDLESFLKTTGGKGLHVVVPLARRHDWEDVKAFSRAVATELAAAEPRSYIATASKAQRKGRIFIDYLRNGRGATAVAPFSTRAREGAPVSTPVDWAELDRGLRPDAYDVANLEERLRRRRRDPWQGFLRLGQTLNPRAKRTLGL